MSVDDIVENVITQLKKQNLLENTYIFFTSDNGFHLGNYVIEHLPYVEFIYKDIYQECDALCSIFRSDVSTI